MPPSIISFRSPLLIAVWSAVVFARATTTSASSAICPPPPSPSPSPSPSTPLDGRRRRRRRPLSLEDQLVILRLSFVPADSPAPPPSKTTTTTTASDGAGVVGRRRWWGVIDDDDDAATATPWRTEERSRRGSSRAGRGGRPPLSTADRLEILRLGFIPPDRTAPRPRGGGGADDASSSSSAGDAIARVGRGGDVVGTTDDDEERIRLRRRRRHRRDTVVVALAFLAGLSNAVCQHRFDCFATMMTGNTIAASTAASMGNWDVAMFRSSLVGGYAVGTAAARSVETTCRRRRRASDGGGGGGGDDDDVTAHLGKLAPIVAAIFAVAEMMEGHGGGICPPGGKNDGGGRQREWDAPLLLAVGYGMVYSSANRALGPTMTHVVTGHITRLGEAFADISLDGVGPSVRVLGSFAVGVVVGAQFSRMSSNCGGGFPFFVTIGVAYALVLASI